MTRALREGFLFGCLLCGCKTIEGTRGVPPFFEIYDTPSSVDATEGAEVLVRPFGSHESRHTIASQEKSERLRIVLPLVDLRWNLEQTRHSILALFHYRSFSQPSGGRDTDWMLFPFVYGGADPDEGAYFAFFPLGGKLKGLLAHDETEFFLFPLYWHWRDRERHSLHGVWPLFNRVWGGDWSGWRLWPFHGRYRSLTEDGQLRYDRGFVFWPFFIRHKDQMNINPTDFFFSLPFYGHRINARTKSYAFLWPFFLTHYDRKYDRQGVFGFLAPFRFTDGQTDVWPLFGIKRFSRGTSLGGIERRNYRHFFLWPIERYDWATDGLEETTRFWLLPLLWHFYYIDNDTLRTETEWKVWPLFRYWRDDGRADKGLSPQVSFDLISPLWFYREDYHRFYDRWFNVFRYRWKPEISGWELLYGALMYRSLPPEEESIFSILGGLLECGQRRGRVVFRLLYVPWW